MKRVLSALAGAIVLVGVSSMGIAQAPEKTERSAATREAQQPKASPAQREPRGRQTDRPPMRR